MSEKSFDDVCQLVADICKFFKAKPGSFYKDGTHSLPNKWRIVFDNNGENVKELSFQPNILQQYFALCIFSKKNLSMSWGLPLGMSDLVLVFEKTALC